MRRPGRKCAGCEAALKVVPVLWRARAVVAVSRRSLTWEQCSCTELTSPPLRVPEESGREVPVWTRLDGVCSTVAARLNRELAVGFAEARAADAIEQSPGAAEDTSEMAVAAEQGAEELPAHVAEGADLLGVGQLAQVLMAGVLGDQRMIRAPVLLAGVEARGAVVEEIDDTIGIEILPDRRLNLFWLAQAHAVDDAVELADRVGVCLVGPELIRHAIDEGISIPTIGLLGERRVQHFDLRA